MNRRRALQGLAISTAAAALSGRMTQLAMAEEAKPATFALPPLGYAYDALEPHIDAATMKVHHTGHHQAYLNNLNGLVESVPDLKTKSFEEVLSNLAAVPDAQRTALRNNLGGHWNHVHFWKVMEPGGAKAPAGDLETAINGTFGSLDKLKEDMNKAGLGRFGSGWSWLVVDKDKKLAVISTPNQDTPFEQGATPVLGIDVWEHAYYLKHQNKRGDYLKTWWNVVNWDNVAANFAKAKG
ncbi:MAG: superoxide dismutase [Hyphomicrobium sp.]